MRERSHHFLVSQKRAATVTLARATGGKSILPFGTDREGRTIFPKNILKISAEEHKESFYKRQSEGSLKRDILQKFRPGRSVFYSSSMNHF